MVVIAVVVIVVVVMVMWWLVVMDGSGDDSVVIIVVVHYSSEVVTLICKRILMQKGTVTIDASPAASKISEDTREYPNVAPTRMRCRWISREYIHLVV